MPNASEMTVEEVKSQISSFSGEELNSMLNDDRAGVVDAAKAEIAARSEAEGPGPEYDPTKDPGPERPEDQVEPDDTPLSAPEVDLESQRKDESSALAGDRYDNEGNRIE